MYLHSASVKDRVLYVFGGSTKFDGAVVFFLNLETLEWSSVHSSRRKSSRTGGLSAADIAARSASAPGVSSSSAAAASITCAEDDNSLSAVIPPVSRYGHTGTVVGDDLILIGGCDRTGKFIPDAFAFSLTRRSWRPLSSMPVPTAYHVAFAWRGKLYTVFGSCPGGVFSTGVQCYDPKTDRWTPIRSTIEPAQGPSAAPAGSAAAAAASGSWGPPVRCGAASAVVGDVLYLFGGYSTSVHADDFWRLDLVNMSWRELTCGPPVAPGAAGARLSAGAGAHAKQSLEGIKFGASRLGGNGSSLAGSKGEGKGEGKGPDGADAAAQCSGAGGSEFRPLARGYCRMVAVGTKLYLYGGYDGKRCISDFRVCDVTPRVVTPLPTVPRPVSVCSVAAVAAGSLRAIINATCRFSSGVVSSDTAPATDDSPAQRPVAPNSALSRFFTMINAACEPAAPALPAPSAAQSAAVGTGLGGSYGSDAVGGPGGLCVSAGPGLDEEDDDLDADVTASIANGGTLSESAAESAAGAGTGATAGATAGLGKNGSGVSRVEAWHGVCAVVKAMFKRQSRSIPNSPTSGGAAAAPGSSLSAGSGSGPSSGPGSSVGDQAGVCPAAGRPSRPLSAVGVAAGARECEEEDSADPGAAAAAADADAVAPSSIFASKGTLTSSISSTSEGSGGRTLTPAVRTASALDDSAAAAGATRSRLGRVHATAVTSPGSHAVATASVAGAFDWDTPPLVSSSGDADKTSAAATGAALEPRPTVTASKSWAEAIADVLFTTSAPAPAPAPETARLAPRSSLATPTSAGGNNNAAAAAAVVAAGLPPPTLRAPSSVASVNEISSVSSPAPSSAAPGLALSTASGAVHHPVADGGLVRGNDGDAAAAVPASSAATATTSGSGARSPASDDDDAELTAALSVDALLAELPPTIPTVVAIALMHEMAAMICRSQRQQAQCWQQLCAAAAGGTEGAAAAAAAMAAAATGHGSITPLERFLLAQSLRGATGITADCDTDTTGTLTTTCGLCGCAGGCGSAGETGWCGATDDIAVAAKADKAKAEEGKRKAKEGAGEGDGEGVSNANASASKKKTGCVACPSCKTTVPIPASASAAALASSPEASPASPSGGCDGTCSRLKTSQSAITPAYSSAAAAAAVAANNNNGFESGELVKSSSEVRKKLVYPFDTSQLERLVEFGYSRGHVLQALARLYDAGKHRACAEISKVIDMLGLEPYDASRTIEPIEVVEEPDLDAELKKTKRDLTRSQTELKSMRDRMMCQICYEGEVKVVMVPCGHLMCQSCGKQCTSHCFFCSQVVTKQQNINGI